MRSPEGRAALGVSNPSCRLRGINGRQLARLSTVFLAFPEEDEQSARAEVPARRSGSGLAPGCGVSAGHPERETRPGSGAALFSDSCF